MLSGSLLISALPNQFKYLTIEDLEDEQIVAVDAVSFRNSYNKKKKNLNLFE